jgi:acyl transferase domain-containing protein
MAIDAPFAAFCSDVAAFDAALFNLSAAEAVTIDPQQRMLIEQTAVALRQAGPDMAEAAAAAVADGSSLSPAAAASLTGVYVGCMNHEWLTVMVAHGTKLAPRAFVGNGAAYMVGRLSYTFGLTGVQLPSQSRVLGGHSVRCAVKKKCIAAPFAMQGLVCRLIQPAPPPLWQPT